MAAHLLPGRGCERGMQFAVEAGSTARVQRPDNLRARIQWLSEPRRAHEAMNAGKDVYSEKSMCRLHEDALIMVKIIQCVCRGAGMRGYFVR